MTAARPSPVAVEQVKAKLDDVLWRHARQGFKFTGVGHRSGVGTPSNINSWINGLLQYRSDALIHGKRDYWETPKEAMERGYSDCEEYAVCKGIMGEELGHTTWLAIVKDGWQWHAVALVGEKPEKRWIRTAWNNSDVGQQPDTRLVLDLPARSKYMLKPREVQWYQMVGPRNGGYQWWPELIFPVGNTDG